MARTTTKPRPIKAVAAPPVVSTGRAADFQIDAAIHDLPDAYLQCRDLQHAWRSHDASYDADARVYVVTLKCTRCKTMRTREIDREGYPVRSGYVYADGYLIPGSGRLTSADRAVVRLEVISGLIGGKTAKRKAG